MALLGLKLPSFRRPLLQIKVTWGWKQWEVSRLQEVSVKKWGKAALTKTWFLAFSGRIFGVIWLQLRLSSKIRNVVYKVCLFWCCYRRVKKWQWFDMKVQFVNPKKEGAVLQWRYFSYAKLSFIRWNYVQYILYTNSLCMCIVYTMSKFWMSGSWN